MSGIDRDGEVKGDLEEALGTFGRTLRHAIWVTIATALCLDRLGLD